MTQTKAYFAEATKQASHKLDGIQQTTTLLYSMSTEQQKQTLQTISQTNPDLHRQLTSKIFFFTDVQLLDNRAIQILLRELNRDELICALIDTTKEIQDLFLHNVSKRQAEDLREEMEIMGNIPPSQQQSAQREILRTMIQLREKGKIFFEKPEK